jgi:hypothetical protein
VALESDNHIVLADDPAWPVFMREMTPFIDMRLWRVGGSAGVVVSGGGGGDEGVVAGLS